MIDQFSSGLRARLLPIASWLAGLVSWRRRLMAMFLGGIATLALPPVYLVPVLLVAFPGLLWLLDGARNWRQAWWIGWWFGFGFFFFSLYWVSFAMLTDIGRFWWLMPIAMTAMPALLAGAPGLVAAGLHPLKLGGLRRVLAFAVLWMIIEWLRGHYLFTGFPWNLLGYVWVGALPVLQWVADVGIYGLSLATVLVAALPAALADERMPARRAVVAILAGLGFFAIIAGAGAVRMAGTAGQMVPEVRLRIVQPAIEQAVKWAPAEREANFRRYLELSAAPPESASTLPPTHLIWPETAVPFFLAFDPEHRMAVAAVTPSGGVTLTGGLRAMAIGPDPANPARKLWRYWNSLLAVDHGGVIAGSYDKFHLVPFGEYFPGRNWLPSWVPVGTVAAGSSDFTPGPGPTTLTLPGLPPFSPLICYEVIFPAEVIDPEHRPQWLLNLTNDGWYGRTAGPHQHFAIARVRAVEEGLPLVRAANTGISGVVDAYGRVTAVLGLGRRGVLDARLPVARPEVTPYGYAGDAPFGLMLSSCILVIFFSRQRHLQAA